jgi:hypothetical protein
MSTRSVAHSVFTGLALTCASALGAQQTGAGQQTTQAAQAALAGVWRLDTTKFVMHDRQLVELTLNVSHQRDTLVVTLNGRDVTGPPFTSTVQYVPETTATAAGSTENAPSQVGRITWAADTMVLRIVQARPGRTLQIEERWNLRPDGATLSRFQSTRDGQRLSQQTLVFTRQP